MAIKEELAAKLARQMAETLSLEIYAEVGPGLDCDIDQIEDVAVLAARAAFDATIARALELQNQQVPRTTALSQVPNQKFCPVQKTNRSRTDGAGRDSRTGLTLPGL